MAITKDAVHEVLDHFLDKVFAAVEDQTSNEEDKTATPDEKDSYFYLEEIVIRTQNALIQSPHLGVSLCTTGENDDEALLRVHARKGLPAFVIHFYEIHE